ncbi:WD40/YVTN/BNR-like repeat-containing protein, partial [Brevibacillus porteri]|uniref:WD40/YVTN/BNR-like repeat-containing protein n=1 Tax=Brevibacillus porteri TaxID=2126350 RepID=UPI00362F1A6B
MKEKVKSLLGTTKKGVVFTAAFTVLVVGAGAAYAASNPSKFVEVTQNQDGSFRYTNDNGKTWKNGLPEEAKATKNADGSETVSIQDPNYSADNFGPEVLIRTDANGKNEEFSTDGGKTWSKKAPAGVQFQELNGTQLPPNTQLQIKQKDDGSSQFSTDGGKTWKDGLPEGAKTTKNADGSQSISIANPNYSAADFGPGVSIRTDANGKNEEFSMDGGKTCAFYYRDGVHFKQLYGTQLPPN